MVSLSYLQLHAPFISLEKIIKTQRQHETKNKALGSRKTKDNMKNRVNGALFVKIGVIFLEWLFSILVMSWISGRLIAFRTFNLKLHLSRTSWSTARFSKRKIVENIHKSECWYGGTERMWHKKKNANISGTKESFELKLWRVLRVHMLLFDKRIFNLDQFLGGLPWGAVACT